MELLILSDELLGAVCSFLPSTESLLRLALTNRRLHSWVTSSNTADEVFREVYQRRFPKSERVVDHRVSGRELWHDNYLVGLSIAHQTQTTLEISVANRSRHASAPFESVSSDGRRSDGVHAEADAEGEEPEAAATRPRRAVRRRSGGVRSEAMAAGHPLTTIEVLPPEEEAEAILYDNHEYGASERQACVGYFGFQPLLGAPAGATLKNSCSKTPIAIWGDFSGLRIAPSWDALLNPLSADRDQLASVHDEKFSQVMDLKIHPQGGYFFLAFASGVVMAVRNDNFKVLSAVTAHACEPTCMAIAPPLKSAQSNTGAHATDPGYLISVCLDGQIYLYPQSLTKMNLEGKICLNPASIPRSPVYSMSATRFASNQMVLCLGGQGLKLSLWQLALKESSGSATSFVIETIGNQDYEYEPHSTYEDQEDEEPEDQQVDHVITHVSFVGAVKGAGSSDKNKKDTLVVGTSRGHILTWDLYAGNPHCPRLHMYTSQERAHCGSIESSERVGNILFTTGGRDGVIKGMDLVSGMPRATLLVHPGRLLAEPPVRLKCAVVKPWVCHDRQSIIGLCRDGHISEWSFKVHTLATSRKPPRTSVAADSKPRTRTAGKRTVAGGRAKATKRPRRASVKSQNSDLVPATAPEQASKESSLTSKRPSGPAKPTLDAPKIFTEKGKNGASLKPEIAKATTKTLHNGTVLPTQQHANIADVPAMVKELPSEAKDLFNQLGFSKWGKLQRPVLVLSPLSVPAGPVRDAWTKEVQAYLKRCNQTKSRVLPPCLIHWLGTVDHRRAYSMIPRSKLTLYEEGITKNYHEIPRRFQQRLLEGKMLGRSDQEYVDGLELLPTEAAKAPEDRSHLLEDFVRDDCERKVHHSFD